MKFHEIIYFVTLRKNVQKMVIKADFTAQSIF